MSKTETSKVNDRHVPEINIGMVGHVDHGKTTLTEALTGRRTDTHSEEIKRGITIRLGYADTTFYRCKKCMEPKCYGTSARCINCFSSCEPVRTVSFVDAPGHETLMATLLTGTSIMDGALLVVAANEQCPQPQTAEHLTALKIAGIKNIIVVQNKIDLVTREQALANYKQISSFVEATLGFEVPIVPISAQHRINIDALIKIMEERIPTPHRDPSLPVMVLIARSFDINKPGTPVNGLRGGVIGGALMQGILKVGDEIEIRPGVKTSENGPYEPIITKVTGIEQARKIRASAVPGGLIGISTGLDPYLTKSDSLSGNIAGIPGKLPPIRSDINLKAHLLETVVGSRDQQKIEPLKKGEPLMITVRTMRTTGFVVSAKADAVQMKSRIPVCVEKGDRVVISRQIGGRWRLIGWGEAA
jgi:translation initiation factor 2 subunit 3